MGPSRRRTNNSADFFWWKPRTSMRLSKSPRRSPRGGGARWKSGQSWRSQDFLWLRGLRPRGRLLGERRTRPAPLRHFSLGRCFLCPHAWQHLFAVEIDHTALILLSRVDVYDGRAAIE